jgi:L-rhamnonate dehydratase
VIKICALAEAAGLPVVPHSNEAYNLHVMFSRAPRVCPVVEYFPNVEPDTGNELFWKIYSGLPVAERAVLKLTNAPGLGIGIRQKVVSKLQVGETAVLRQ